MTTPLAKPNKLQYISASRRNDLPRFHTQAFFDAWRRGAVTYNGGYGRSYTVSLLPEHVMGYIFWSKDFAPLRAHPDFPVLLSRNNALFHFTINDMPALEPNLPALEQRLTTLSRLCRMVGPERVLWRFDPICRYRDSTGRIVTTDAAFYRIFPFMASEGITRCYFSFMTAYNKLRGRPVDFMEIPVEEQIGIAVSLRDAGRQAGITLYNCCNTHLRNAVEGIEQAHCIDESLLAQTDRFGVHRPLKQKPTRMGCGCYESRDIGSYEPPCPHGCLYCYAKPAQGGISC
ncbi:MAG: DUF1848 family protein [Chitinivibrionales bacterium]|nr:DUF1848 family protein [Chitinivibrionales bacterium]MBD3355947.1 DUF1848 family protein [Chitinivibrionales bacterium]